MIVHRLPLKNNNLPVESSGVFDRRLHDIERGAMQETRIMEKLDQICQSVDGLGREVSSLVSGHGSLEDRITKLELENSSHRKDLTELNTKYAQMEGARKGAESLTGKTVALVSIIGGLIAFASYLGNASKTASQSQAMPPAKARTVSSEKKLAVRDSNH